VLGVVTISGVVRDLVVLEAGVVERSRDTFVRARDELVVE
jgi:hypothetical protein